MNKVGLSALLGLELFLLIFFGKSIEEVGVNLPKAIFLLAGVMLVFILAAEAVRVTRRPW